MVLAVLPIVELVEVAEGVLEPSDHLGTHPDCFLFKNRSWNMEHVLNVHFWSRIAYLSCTWKSYWKISEVAPFITKIDMPDGSLALTPGYDKFLFGLKGLNPISIVFGVRGFNNKKIM